MLAKQFQTSRAGKPSDKYSWRQRFMNRVQNWEGSWLAPRSHHDV
jgi:hypothetical protein